MTHLYFVRHAQPNFHNHDDYNRELSEKGLQDRRYVTEFLRDKSVDVVLSSPFKRAVNTVKDFADTYGYVIHTVEDFRERKVDNCWIEDFYSFSKKQWENFDYRLTDGESLNEVQQRNIRALKQVLQQYKNKTVVIGSHGTALSTMINYYQPEFAFARFEQIKNIMPWIVHFMFDGECCVRIDGYNPLENMQKASCLYRL